MADDVVGVGKGLEAIEKMSREGRQLMYDLAGPAAKEIGELFADRIRFQRYENLSRMADRVQKALADRGLQAKAVDLKLLVPMLEEASLESNEDLRSKWVGLLTSAAAGNPVHASYPRILAELEPAEARILQWFHDYELTHPRGPTLNQWSGWMYSVHRDQVEKELELTPEEMERHIQHLTRLGLCELEEDDPLVPVVEVFRSLRRSGQDLETDEMMKRMIDGLQHQTFPPKKQRAIALTEIGLDFLKVCQGPSDEGSASPAQ